MHSHDDEMGLVDGEATICLCRQGVYDYWAGSVIDGDGHESLWLLDARQLNAPTPCGNPFQSHEGVGPLPPAWQARIEAENQNDDDGKAQP